MGVAQRCYAPFLRSKVGENSLRTQFPFSTGPMHIFLLKNQGLTLRRSSGQKKELKNRSLKMRTF